MIKNLKNKLCVVVCMAAVFMLSSNKEEGRNPAFSDNLNSIDGMVQVDGTPLVADSLRGKMVIVNFWASYDATSRMNNYQLLQLMDEYSNAQFSKGSGLEVLSVSLDTYKSPLKKAIKMDGTEQFHHICDYKGMESDVARLFDVNRPVNMLVDAEGTIVARDFNVESLRSTLELLAMAE